MIEKWKESLDQGGTYGALLTDLLKAFECVPYELIIAKLHTYGVHVPSLKLINSYLSKRRQRLKINDVYSSWSEILFGGTSGLHSSGFDNCCTSRTYVPLFLLAYARFWICVR